jgi:alpha-1,2-mannosyltransferase
VARRPLTWALLLVTAVVAGWVEVARGFIDLDVYRFGGTALVDGVGLYDGADPETGLPFTYPPVAALLMAPLAEVPQVVLAGLWAAASVAALLAVVRLLLPEHEPRVVLAVTAGLLLLEPVWQSLSFGQVNLFLMLLVAHDVLRPDRRTAGIAIGIAAGIKLTPLVFVVLLVLAGRRVPAVRAVAAFAGTVAVGFLVAAGDSATYWTHTLWDPARIGGLSFTSNQSVNGLLVRLLGHEPPTLLWLAVAGAASGALLVLGALWWRRGQADLALLLGALSVLLASPVSWSHHWVWAAPAALVLWRRSRPIAVAWLVLFASNVIWWPPHRNDLELGWGPFEHLYGNAYLWAALLVGGWLLAELISTTPGDEGRPAAPRPSMIRTS